MNVWLNYAGNSSAELVGRTIRQPHRHTNHTGIGLASALLTKWKRVVPGAGISRHQL